VVTIGVFDGVHRGHRHIVGRALAEARTRGLPAAVVTFDPHPGRVLRPAAAPALLSTLEHRLDLLAALGVDAALVLAFTTQLAGLTPDQFAHTVLAEGMRAAHVVVGANFRFGHRAAGDVAALRELGQRLGFTVEAVSLVRGGGEPESSTQVRAAVAVGDVEQAARSLGRLHRVEGPVVRGDARGRTIGYPTANVEVSAQAAVPADGVYAGWLVRGGPPAERLPAAISIGTNPTFDGRVRRVEAYVLDRDDLTLYGEQVALDFVVRLRGQERFDSVEELITQMDGDVERARTALGLRQDAST